jgi:predicted dehydrogenase
MTKVGIIGMGRSGWELHAVPLSKLPQYCVAAICDQSEARRDQAAQQFGARPYYDPHKLIADKEVDLVVVAVPGSLHTTLTIAALEAGKDVVVEKPMANTLAEADQMLAAAEQSGRLLTVFHNRRWDGDYQLVKTLVQAGEIGELLTIDSRVMTYGPEWATYGVAEFNPRWRTQAAYGGGFLTDWGPHLAYQCLELVSEWPTAVYCQLRSQLWATEVDDYFNVRLTFPSGLLVTLEGSNNARVPLPRWFIVGRQGTLVSEGTWGRWTEMRIRKSAGEVAMDVVPQDVGPSSGARGMEVVDELSARFYCDLAEAMAMDRPPAITATCARDVIAVLDAARQSHLSGQVVSLSKPRGSWR